MSVEEMKIAVHKSIDSLNEQQLEQVNVFIDSINKNTIHNSNYLQQANIIINERAEVLSKLAQ